MFSLCINNVQVRTYRRKESAVAAVKRDYSLSDEPIDILDCDDTGYVARQWTWIKPEQRFVRVWLGR